MWKSVQFYGVSFLLLLHVFWGMCPQATRLAWPVDYLLGHLSCLIFVTLIIISFSIKHPDQYFTYLLTVLLSPLS